jgi:uncharacterized protein (DUF885 family)
MAPIRTPSEVDRIADSYLDDMAALNPAAATYWGIAGGEDQLPALSPDWHESVSELRTRTLAALSAATPADAADRTTVKALHDELSLAEELRAAGDDLGRLNTIESPVQSIRDVFDLMPTDTAADWATIARRMAAVPTALAGYRESLRASAARGLIRAKRQVAGCVTRCESNAAADGFFHTFANSATVPLPESVQADLRRASEHAATAYAELGEFLSGELLPDAPDQDAFGREEYALHSRLFLGTAVDLDEAYRWGQDELARIRADMAATADRISSGASVPEAFEVLNADPAGQLHGVEKLREWMQQTSDAAVEALGKEHFDIPDVIRRLDCRIAPSNSGGVYYTQPTEDLVTRPGTMWWSVPKGLDSFTTWQEVSAVYHEGVPGHHLQIAHTLLQSDLLNRWRRIGSWVSGHGEGWALYAERLMAELGYLTNDGARMGWLDSASLRAARVVIDIGVHCRFEAPAEVGGGEFSYEKAWQYLLANCSWDSSRLDFELNRYLGWPGQAPSYKLGERFWLQLREEAKAKAGAEFDLRDFHRRALDVGSVGLDALREAMV